MRAKLPGCYGVSRTAPMAVRYDRFWYTPSNRYAGAICGVLEEFTIRARWPYGGCIPFAETLMSLREVAATLLRLNPAVVIPGVGSDDPRDEQRGWAPEFVVVKGSLFQLELRGVQPVDLIERLLNEFTWAVRLLHDPADRSDWDWIGEWLDGAAVCFASREGVA